MLKVPIMKTIIQHSFKKFLVLSFLLISFTMAFGQYGYEGIKYQAIIRNASGKAVGSQAISMRFTIYQKTDQINEFVEIHNYTTNVLGLVNLTIGQGRSQSSVLFHQIKWGNSGSDPFYLKIEVDENGGNVFRLLGESRMYAVPYALHAKTADDVDDADADAQNEIQVLSLNAGTDDLTLSIGGGKVDLSSYMDNTDSQILSYNQATDSLEISNGNRIYLGVFDLDNRFKAHLAAYAADQAAIQARLKSLSDSAATNYSRITNDSIRMTQMGNSLNSRIIADSSRLNAINGRIVADSIRLNGMNGRIVADSLRLNTTNSTLNSHNTRITTNTSDIANLQAGAYKDSSTTNETITQARISGDSLEITEAGKAWKVDLKGFSDSSAVNLNKVGIAKNETDIATNRQAISADTARLSAHVLAMKDSSATNEIQALSIVNDSLILLTDINGKSDTVKLPAVAINKDNDSTNEKITDIAVINDTLVRIIENGDTSSFSLSGLLSHINDNADSIDVVALDLSDLRTLVGDTASFLNDSIDVVASNLSGHITADQDLSDTNEIQALSIVNDSLILLTDINGKSDTVKLPAVAINKDNDSTNEKITDIAVINDTLVRIIENGDTSSFSLSGLLGYINDNADSIDVVALDLSDLRILVGDTASFLNDSIDVVASNLSTHITADMDLSDTNEIQALSIVNDSLILLTDINGKSDTVKLPAVAINKDNDSTNEKITDIAVINDTLVRIIENGDTSSFSLSGLLSYINDNADSIDVVALDLSDLRTLVGDTASFLNDSIDVVASNLSGHITSDQDLSDTNELQMMTISNDTIFLTDINGKSDTVKLPTVAINKDNDSTNEKITDIAVINDTLVRIIENGDTSSFSLSGLLGYINDNADSIDVVALDLSDLRTLVGDTASFLNDSIDVVASNLSGHITSDQDLSDTNELQMMTISNDTIFLTDINGKSDTVKLPTVAINKDNDSTNEKITDIAVINDTLVRIIENGDTSSFSLSGLLGYINDNADSIDVVALDLSDLRTLVGDTASFLNDSIDVVASNLSGHITSDQDLSDTNELQMMTISNDTIFLTDINGKSDTVKLPTVAINKDNDSTNEKITDIAVINDTLVRINRKWRHIEL